VLCSERTAQDSATLVEPSTTELSTFDAVVLVDVPALDLDFALLNLARSPLRPYVDDGGELVVIGGPDSYGLGGYTDTALDDVLPVSTKLPQRKDTPSVAVALIIEDLATQSNVNISKVAGEGMIKLLTPADARIKHIIVLGVAVAADSYFAPAAQIRKAGITISTVATGDGTCGFGADYGTMQNSALGLRRHGSGSTWRVSGEDVCYHAAG
jgi:hypothetical protein